MPWSKGGGGGGGGCRYDDENEVLFAFLGKGRVRSSLLCQSFWQNCGYSRYRWIIRRRAGKKFLVELIRRIKKDDLITRPLSGL